MKNMDGYGICFIMLILGKNRKHIKMLSIFFKKDGKYMY